MSLDREPDEPPGDEKPRLDRAIRLAWLAETFAFLFDLTVRMGILQIAESTMVQRLANQGGVFDQFPGLNRSVANNDITSLTLGYENHQHAQALTA